MKKQMTKLTLSRETLSQLDAGKMQGVAGGKGPTAIDCSVTCLRADDGPTAIGC